MDLHSINDLSNKKLINFLKKNLNTIDDKNIIKNYHPKYKNVPGNLFYILNEGRYKVGNYYILEENEKLIACAGWNHYNDDTALLLTRAFISEEYRRKYFLSKFFLPRMFEETTKYKKLWITCNEYNISIYHAIERLNNGKSAGLFDQWPSIYSKFKPIGKKIVNYTEQYVLEWNSNNYD